MDSAESDASILLDQNGGAHAPQDGRVVVDGSEWRLEVSVPGPSPAAAPREAGKAEAMAAPPRAMPGVLSVKRSAGPVQPSDSAVVNGAAEVTSAKLAVGAEASAAPPPAASPGQGKGAGPTELPKAHQMLDSAPSAPPTLPPAAGARDAATTVQMHTSLRTEAFGVVEIHTVVQQSQVGLTVHGDRELARWFSSEVPGLQSGLNKSHLNLRAVDFENGPSGSQTASGFQQGQSRDHSSASRSLPSGDGRARVEENERMIEPATPRTPAAAPYAGEAKLGVNVHV
jgi:hypothetical protein